MPSSLSSPFKGEGEREVESNILKNNVFCYEVCYTYFGIEFLPYPKKLFKIANLFYSIGISKKFKYYKII